MKFAVVIEKDKYMLVVPNWDIKYNEKEKGITWTDNLDIGMKWNETDLDFFKSFYPKFKLLLDFETKGLS